MRVSIHCKDLSIEETYSYEGVDCENYENSGWLEERRCDTPTVFNLFRAKSIMSQAKKADWDKSQYEYYIKPVKET